MKRSCRFAAVLLAVSSSVAWAQNGAYGGGPASNAAVGASFAISPYGGAGNLGLGSTGPLFAPSGGGVAGSAGLGQPPSLLGTYGDSSGATGSGYVAPPSSSSFGSGPMSNPLSPGANYPLVNCHPGGCSGIDGTQYARGAGNVMFGSNGRICQYTAPGAPLVCN